MSTDRTVSDTASRVKRIIEYFGDTDSAFSKRVGVDKASLSKILSGQRTIGEGVINKIVLATNFRKEWIAEGKGDPLLSEEEYYTRFVKGQPNEEDIIRRNKLLLEGGGGGFKEPQIKMRVTTREQPQSNVKHIAPYIGEDLVNVQYVPAKAYASFIESMYSVEYDLETYGVRPEEEEDLTKGKYMVFDIEGDSMYPTIQSGSKILCEKICESNWEYAKGVIVIVYGKTLTIKRIHKNNLYINNTITIKADNPKYGEIDVEKCEIRGMWQAVRVISMKIV